jgi:hypothetical protein
MDFFLNNKFEEHLRSRIKKYDEILNRISSEKSDLNDLYFHKFMVRDFIQNA